MFKKIFATMVAAITLVVFATVSVSAANYSSWAEEILERLNAVDSHTNLTKDATREEVALIIADLCDSYEALPSKATIDFEDENDFESSKTYKTVAELSSTGIVTGYPDGTYGPENDITRAEALTIILRTVDYLCLETESYRRGSSFTDMDGHWAEVYAERAYEQGLISGRGNGRFYPDDQITREEVITILVNLLGESNNPLIAAVDKVYGLEFENYSSNINDRYYDDDDRYYDDRYYDDDDYEELTKRPTVNTGSSSNNSNTNSSSTTTTNRPERPVVDTTSSSSGNVSDGSKPSRPVVDTTTTSNSTSSSVERPSIDIDTEESASSRPTRPAV